MGGKRWGLLFSAFFTAHLFAGPSPEFLKTTCRQCHGPEKQKGDQLVRFAHRRDQDTGRRAALAGDSRSAQPGRDATA
jgi:hypothetical protein